MRRIFNDHALQSEFNRRGFVVVPLLEDREVAELSRVWYECDVPIHAQPFSASVMSADAEYRDRVNDAIGRVFESKIADVLDNYRYSFGNFLVKRAMSPGAVPLHQDGMFVEEARFESINFWVALGDVGPKNGCLQVMPGSHTLNFSPRGTNRRFPYPQFERIIRERYLVDVAMPVGWACIMSQRTFHASDPNSSNEHRLAASALAVPAESRMFYLYEDSNVVQPGIDVYEADDAFFRAQVFGAPPPPNRTPMLRLQPEFDPLTEERLAKAFLQAVC